MERHQGDIVSKQNILSEVARCVKMIFARCSSSAELSFPLTMSSQLVVSIDAAMYNGLLNVARGYWPLVSSCSHKHTVQTVDQCVGSQGSPRSKGQAWLLATLVEGSLQSYLECMLGDSQTISRFYSPCAIMRDSDSISQFCSLLRGLETIPFQAAEINDSIDEIRLCQPIKDLGSFSKASLSLSFDNSSTAPASSILTMTTSMTSSLASPGDSGFTQLDSETDTASCSEMVFGGDSASIKEDVALHTLSSYAEPLTASDIANGNTSSVNNTSFNNGGDDDDEIVFRKPKTCKGKSSAAKQQKRVSFHDSTSKLHNDETCTLLVSEVVTPQKIGNFFDSLTFSPPSLSSALVGVPSLSQELDGVEIGKDSSILCCNKFSSHCEDEVAFNLHLPLKPRESSSILQTVMTIFSGTNHPEDVCGVSEERGMPEGQEDPPMKCQQYIGNAGSCDSELLDLSNTPHPREAPSPIPSCSSMRPQFSSPRHMPSRTNASSAGSVLKSSVLNQTPSKVCLVNRFLRSLTEKKLSNCRLAAAISAAEMKAGNSRKCSLYIPGVKPLHNLTKELIAELEEELSDALVRSTKTACLNTQSRNILVVELFDHLLSSSETIYKIVKVQSSSTDSSGKRTPLYAVVTNQALHVCNTMFVKQTSIHLSHISSFLVGPGSQWMMLKRWDGSTDAFVFGETDGAATLIGSIEFMLRKKKGTSSSLPAVAEMALKDLLWSSVLQGEHVTHYSVVHAVEESFGSPSTPLLPVKKAHFMYRLNKGYGATSWEPGFFVLKAGVLYLFTDEGEGEPYKFGLRGLYPSIVHNASRPHTIEVGSLHIAAPDNCVACDWFQAFQACSTGVCNEGGELKANFFSGSLVLTDSRILLFPSLGMVWEPTRSSEPLLAGYLSDVTSLSVGDFGCCWCIVELSCREVQVSGGDYIMFFNTYDDVISFTNKVCEINPSVKEVTQLLTENESLRQKCEIAASKLLLG